MPGPLDGLTVVDLSEYICGPYATKLLADFGADVIKVERPGGDPARRVGPFPGNQPDPEKSGTFFYFNTNKRSIELDLASTADREALLQLIDRADAVVESFPPGYLDGLGIGWDVIHGRRPDIPLISITNFGQESPYRDYVGNELTLYALAGELYTMGVQEREPVTMYGTASLVESGSAAATATFAAIFASKRQGIGQRVDFSIADSHFLGADRRHVGTISYEFSGRRTVRASRSNRAALSGVYPCADGWVEFTAASGRMDRFADMLGNPEWIRDPKWSIRATLLDPDNVAELEAHFFEWLSERTKREIWAAARAARVLCGPLFDVAELSADSHFRDRGFWATANHAWLGEITIPGRPFVMPKAPWSLRRPAPLLNEHGAEIRAEIASRPALAPTVRTSNPRLPLDGIRVIDLCVVWAGPFATLLLGDLGAEVLKAENPHVMQPMTRGTLAHPTKAYAAMLPPAAGGYPNNDPAPHAYNYSPTFVQLYRNKKSFTVDLRTEEGKEIFGRVVAQSDAVVENNATETLEGLGITYDWLRKYNPQIIMVRIPAYGSTGPYNQARALGVHLESVMGHTLLRGYRDADPSENSAIYSGDYLAGAQAALAVMLGVWHREKTGEGQLIEIGQAENASPMLAQAFMEYAMNGTLPERRGNRSLYDFAPTGVYACRPSGTAEECGDRWIAISIETDEQWRALRGAMGDPAWSKDPALDTNAGRLAAHDAIDAQLAAWTADKDDYELFHALQEAGVPSAPVLEASRAFDDAHVLARGLYQPQTLYDQVGTFRFNTPFLRFSETPTGVRQPPVAFGEHNDYVYRELLGISDAEYQRLVEAGHIAQEFDATIP
ncbi:CoA transferase [Candidatus Amarobacter glycogenicus]|uniref:CaiB/BaiF CoA transferase family protein n=1 Tax=Candidatus Amarobacter glycogenicus TaxID=3140699 RepID=UPI003134FFBE|nr:CoA transferase [Dehalococcoidia bacterium]